MKILLTAVCLVSLAGAAAAFDLEGIGAADLKGGWGSIPVPSGIEILQEKDFSACRSYPLSMRLKGRTVTLPAKGVWTLESHLATRADTFPGRRSFPRTVKENIPSHLQNSCGLLGKFVRGLNCGQVYSTRWDKEWTPPENGKAGQGAVGNTRPSAEEEMWVFNMMWVGKSMPRPGTKFLATYNGRSVVVVGGYERGPASGRFLGGFQREVLWYLGATEDSSRITLSALKNQELRPGPIDCAAR